MRNAVVALVIVYAITAGYCIVGITAHGAVQVYDLPIGPMRGDDPASSVVTSPGGHTACKGG